MGAKHDQTKEHRLCWCGKNSALNGKPYCSEHKPFPPDPYACPYEYTAKPIGWSCLCINCRGADM